MKDKNILLRPLLKRFLGKKWEKIQIFNVTKGNILLKNIRYSFIIPLKMPVKDFFTKLSEIKEFL